MKLSELRQIIKEIMSDEEIVATLKKQLDPKSTVKVTKPVVKPNVIYTDKMNEVEINGKIVRTYTQNGDKSYNVTYDDGTTDRIAVSNDAWDEINNLKKQNMNEEEELSEAYVPDNIKKFAKQKGASSLVNKIAGWAEKAGKGIRGGTAIGKNYSTLILDLSYQDGAIRINLDNDTVELYGEEVNNFNEFKSILAKEPMDKMDINEEFKRMQKIAGVINENSNPNRML